MLFFRSFFGLFIVSLFIGCSSGTSADTNESDQDNAKTEITPPKDLDQNPADKDSVTTELTDPKDVSNIDNPPKDPTKNIPDISEKPSPKPTQTTTVTPVNNPPVQNLIGPRITFNSTRYDYGTIDQGEKITKSFPFRNTGDIPLNILNVEVTCGCTTPSYPFLSINPGEKGTISITFDSKLKEGKQESKITVNTDAYPQVHYLYLDGFVEKPEKDKSEEDSEDGGKKDEGEKTEGTKNTGKKNPPSTPEKDSINN